MQAAKTCCNACAQGQACTGCASESGATGVGATRYHLPMPGDDFPESYRGYRIHIVQAALHAYYAYVTGGEMTSTFGPYATYALAYAAGRAAVDGHTNAVWGFSGAPATGAGAVADVMYYRGFTVVFSADNGGAIYAQVTGQNQGGVYGPYPSRERARSQMYHAIDNRIAGNTLNGVPRGLAARPATGLGDGSGLESLNMKAGGIGAGVGAVAFGGIAYAMTKKPAASIAVGLVGGLLSGVGAAFFYPKAGSSSTSTTTVTPGQKPPPPPVPAPGPPPSTYTTPPAGNAQPANPRPVPKPDGGSVMLLYNTDKVQRAPHQ